MPVFEKGPVRIRYEERGQGFPLLVIPGGGLNATMAGLGRTHPFNPMEAFSDRYRCITMDLRNADGGESEGPVEVERPWDAYADDQIGLLDHLGVERFMVLGFCIGGPFIWNLLKRVGPRVAAAVIVQPSGFRPEMPDQFFQNNMANWGPKLCARRADVDMAVVERFLTRMYRESGDFVFTVDRDFVRGCQTPVLVMPDDIAPHPYAVAMESARLAPNAQVSMYPWKDRPEHIPMVLRHVRMFMSAHAG